MTDTTGGAELDPEVKKLVGVSTGRNRVVVERGPVANFATAVCDRSSVYSDPREAEAAGYRSIPVPPTYPFVWETWGRFPEIQPEAGEGNAMAGIIGNLMSKGGTILHGEQEFIYHRPVFVGDVLTGEGKVTDVYQKESKGHVMTFVVNEVVWTDDATGEVAVVTKANIIHRI